MGKDEKKNGIGLAVCCAIGGTALAVTGVSWAFLAPALRKVCLPYVPASDQQVRAVVRALDGCKAVIDLGSGDGRIVMAAANTQGRIAHGVELNPWLVLYSRIAAKRAGLSANTAFYKRDLWSFDLSPYDGISIFGVEQMMDRLAEKIKKEVRPGTVVVACRFPFTDLEPVQTRGCGIDTVWKYKF